MRGRVLLEKVALGTSLAVTLVGCPKSESVRKPATPSATKSAANTSLPTAEPQARAVSVGEGHVCVLRGRALFCAGDGSRGQIGPKLESHDDLRAVEGMTDVEEVSATDYTLVRHTTGQVTCLGCSSGHGTFPKELGITRIAAFGTTGAAIDREARVLRWDSLFFAGTNPIDPVPGAARAVAVAQGGGEDCAPGPQCAAVTCTVTRTHTVQCIARFDAGLLGASPPIGPESWMPGDPSTFELRVHDVPGIDDALDVRVGRDHACALRKDGTVSCWGESKRSMRDRPTLFERLGLSKYQAGQVVSLPGARNAVGISSYQTGVCVVVSDGKLQCFGDVPPPPPGLPPLAGVSLGSTSCGVTRAGGVVCWGLLPRTEPARVVDLEGAKAVFAGWTTACAVQADRSLSCWGQAVAGMPGSRSASTIDQYLSRPVAVPTARDVTSIAIAEPGVEGHDDPAPFCAVRTDGGVECFASDGTKLPDLGARDAQSITLFGDTLKELCVVRRNGKVACAGKTPFATRSARLTDVPGVDDAVRAVMSEQRVCALTRSGKLYCAGSKELTSDGDPPRERRFHQVPGLGEVIDLALSEYEGWAVERSGAMVRFAGTVGAPGDLPPPTRLPVTDAVRIYGGRGHALCVIHRTGAVGCWGVFPNGPSIGDDPPRPIAGFSGAVELAVGSSHACARFDDGSVRCVGGWAVGNGYTPGGLVTLL